MLKYVSYDDMFEKIPVYADANVIEDSVRFENIQHDTPLMEVPYEYAFDFLVSGAFSFTILNENDKAYYTYSFMYGSQILTYYAESIYDELTCPTLDFEYGNNYYKSITHEHGKLIVAFNFLPDGVIRLKHDSPIQFKTENDFHTFLHECWHNCFDSDQHIDGFTIPLTDDGTFDESLVKELKVHYRSMYEDDD